MFGQSFVFDTTQNFGQLKNYYYSKTDFSFIDTLELWNYMLDTNRAESKEDSIKTVGHLNFRRIKPVDDSISKLIYGGLWIPNITFDIYAIADTNFCYQKSSKTRFFSSCVPPNVGGDIIITDKYVFLSRGVCLNCERYDTKIDYCRPVINYIFSHLDNTKITTIQSLVIQFTIDEGKF